MAELNQWGVPDRVKVIIDQGHHPEEPKGEGNDGSRSGWLFDAVCQLVRQGVPDEVVYAIITDPGWRISESVLELKGRAERYALRQIQRAHEHVEDPVLARMNADHAVLLQEGFKVKSGRNLGDALTVQGTLVALTVRDAQV